jgi:Tfp pilus assembly protein PilF
VQQSDVIRLETWKEIAAFLKCDERTAKRWEAQRRLPVHRLPGPNRSRIYAIPAELDAWRDRSGGEDGVSGAEPGTVSKSERRAGAGTGVGRLRGRLRRLALLPVLALALGTGAAWLLSRPSSSARADAPHAPSQAAEQAYVAATLAWRQRTPESLEQAEHLYRAAIASDPSYADAYAGLANTYDLLREYGGMPDAEAYPLAKANALKAIALDPHSSGGHAALAFAEYWGFWNVPQARQAFARAVALDSSNATAHHWYATFLSNLGETRAAQREIDIAAALDPQSLSIAADRGLILAIGDDPARGSDALRRLAAANPGLTSPLVYLAKLSLLRGDYPEYLDAARRLAALHGDETARAAARAAASAYARGGRTALLARLIADRRAAYAKGEASAYDLATLYWLAGDGAGALAELQTSADRHESAFLQITDRMNFRELRASPGFRAMLSRIQPLDA